VLSIRIPCITRFSKYLLGFFDIVIQCREVQIMPKFVQRRYEHIAGCYSLSSKAVNDRPPVEGMVDGLPKIEIMNGFLHISGRTS
jgi:hypothetical protein